MQIIPSLPSPHPGLCIRNCDSRFSACSRGRQPRASSRAELLSEPSGRFPPSLFPFRVVCPFLIRMFLTWIHSGETQRDSFPSIGCFPPYVS